MINVFNEIKSQILVFHYFNIQKSQDFCLLNITYKNLYSMRKKILICNETNFTFFINNLIHKQTIIKK
jgi:hypothetical protein